MKKVEDKKMAEIYEIKMLVLFCFLAGMIFLCIVDGYGDGIVFKYSSDKPTLNIFSENEQVAVISHNGGIEHLIIALNLYEAGQMEGRAVWMFPIPSDPNSVKLDIVKDFVLPSKGRDLRE